MPVQLVRFLCVSEKQSASIFRNTQIRKKEDARYRETSQHSAT